MDDEPDKDRDEQPDGLSEPSEGHDEQPIAEERADEITPPNLDDAVEPADELPVETSAGEDSDASAAVDNLGESISAVDNAPLPPATLALSPTAPTGDTPPAAEKPDGPVWVDASYDETSYQFYKLVYGFKDASDAPAGAASAAASDVELPPGVNPGDTSGRGTGPPRLPVMRPKAGSGSAAIAVEVRVSVTDAGLERLSDGAARRTAKESDAKVMIVARKLEQIESERRALETQRRIVWGR